MQRIPTVTLSYMVNLLKVWACEFQRRRFFKVFPLYRLMGNMWAPGRGTILEATSRGHNVGGDLNLEIPRFMLAYFISKLCALWFQRRRFLKLLYFPLYVNGSQRAPGRGQF